LRHSIGLKLLSTSLSSRIRSPVRAPSAVAFDLKRIFYPPLFTLDSSGGGYVRKFGLSERMAWMARYGLYERRADRSQDLPLSCVAIRCFEVK